MKNIQGGCGARLLSFLKLSFLYIGDIEFVNIRVRPLTPALDFVTGLPETQNPTTGICYDMICTIIDGLTKYARFILHKITMTAEKLAKLILKKIFTDYGIPEQIINDKNKLFTSKFNTKL